MSHIEKTILDIVFRYMDSHGLSPHEINDGFCHTFAKEVACIVPGAIVAWVHKLDAARMYAPYRRHAFIEFEARFYDEECPAGVDDWLQLPFFVREKG